MTVDVTNREILTVCRKKCPDDLNVLRPECRISGTIAWPVAVCLVEAVLLARPVVVADLGVRYFSCRNLHRGSPRYATDSNWQDP